MEEFKSQAKEKLEKEYTECKGKLTNIEKAMASAVYDTLRGFIEQDDEFAQSIVQNSQTFANCMSAVAKNVKSSISDLEAYKKAVQFYFPGAEVEFQMKIHVNPYDMPTDSADAAKGEYKTLSLLDLLG